MHQAKLPGLKLILLTVAVLLGGGALLAASCIGSTAEPEPFIITWNYDTSGYLETCGCSAHQLGGIARRATMIRRLREKQPVLAIEGAHIEADAGEYQLFKGETIVRGLNLMGYDAMQLGVREAQHGGEGINKLTELADFPCFSANLVVNDKPWPVASTVLKVAGASVGITGASQPEFVSFELPAGVNFSDPKSALDLEVATLTGDVDLVVLCLEGECTWLAMMITRYASQVDLFLTGDRLEATAGLDFAATPPHLNNWKLGKYLGVIAVNPTSDGFNFAGENIGLGDELADDEAVSEMMERDYRSQLKERFFGQLKVDLEAIYLPPDYCENCHPVAYESYLASGHSRALDSLLDKGQLYNPDCMGCHVSYDPDNDELFSMNCITCHFNITEDHVWDALDDPAKITPPDPPVTSYTPEHCGTCHDELNSLPFATHWPQYAAQLYHGGDMSAAKAAAERMDLDLTEPPPEG